MLLGFFVDYLIKFAGQVEKRVMTAVWVMAFLIAVVLNPIVSLTSQYHQGVDLQITDTVDYILSNTKETDTVLVWGSEPLVNFFSGRRLPTRYIHHYPFYISHYASEDRAEELLNELRINKPVLIIDTMNQDTPFVNGKDKEKCAETSPWMSEGLGRVFEYVCLNYELSGNIGPEYWRIYQVSGSIQ